MVLDALLALDTLAASHARAHVVQPREQSLVLPFTLALDLFLHLLLHGLSYGLLLNLTPEVVAGLSLSRSTHLAICLFPLSLA